MKLYYNLSIGNYGESHDNLFKALFRLLKLSIKHNKKIKFKIIYTK